MKLLAIRLPGICNLTNMVSMELELPVTQTHSAIPILPTLGLVDLGSSRIHDVGAHV